MCQLAFDCGTGVDYVASVRVINIYVGYVGSAGLELFIKVIFECKELQTPGIFIIYRLFF